MAAFAKLATAIAPRRPRRVRRCAQLALRASQRSCRALKACSGTPLPASLTADIKKARACRGLKVTI